MVMVRRGFRAYVIRVRLRAVPVVIAREIHLAAATDGGPMGRSSKTVTIVVFRRFFVKLINFQPWEYSLLGLCP